MQCQLPFFYSCYLEYDRWNQISQHCHNAPSRNGTGTGINIQLCLYSRYLGCNLFDADSLSGLERYLYSILGWEDAEEQIFILENILLHSPEATDHSVPSREFTLTAILSQTERTQQRPDFQLRLEEFLREKIPAHLRFTVHWLPPKELALFVKDYKAWRKAWADNDNKEIGRTGEILKNNLIRINIEL